MRNFFGMLLMLVAPSLFAGEFYAGAGYHHGQTHAEGSQFGDRFAARYAHLRLGYAISPVVSFQLRYGGDLGPVSGSDKGVALELKDQRFVGIYNRLDWNMLQSLDLFILMGATHNKGSIDARYGSSSDSVHKTGFSFGLGLEYEFGQRFGVEVEYWLQNTDPNYKTDSVGLSLLYYFR